jgi:photosystem II stability/assembly factor-like uncharacterized protein
VNDLAATDTAVYAATGTGVLKSTDGGETWTTMNNGLQSKDIRSIGADRAHDSILYVGTFGAGVFKTTNGGEKWEPVGSL